MLSESSHLPAETSTGTARPGFEAVRTAFDEMLAAEPDFSAQVTAIWRGHVVVDLAGGPHLDAGSITGVFSATKGIAAVVIGILLDRQLLDLDEPVMAYWPEFGAAGKSAITVRDLLSHRAGVLGGREGFTPEELADSSRAAARLAASSPVWRPGSTHGYHALTIGVLMEELSRRICGRTLQEIYETEIRAPRDIDFYLGLPEQEEARFRPVVPPRMPRDPASSPEGATDTLQSLAFNALNSVFPPDAGAMGPNSRAMRAAGTAAINGIGSSRGLAEVYGSVLGSEEQPGILSPLTIERMSQQHSFGLDRVLGHITAFGLVFMKPHPQMEFGSFAAFGHDGAGGALGFADPVHDLAFGYIPMPMQLPGGADARAVRLSQIVRACIRAAGE